MESVDAETNGLKGGGTHFTISDEPLFLEYKEEDNEAAAKAKLEGEVKQAKRGIEEGNVEGKYGAIVGKYYFSEEHPEFGSDVFCLRWTNVNRYTLVCSASKQALEEFQAIYEL